MFIFNSGDLVRKIFLKNGRKSNYALTKRGLLIVGNLCPGSLFPGLDMCSPKLPRRWKGIFQHFLLLSELSPCFVTITFFFGIPLMWSFSLPQKQLKERSWQSQPGKTCGSLLSEWLPCVLERFAASSGRNLSLKIDLSHLPQAHSLFLFHLNLPDMSHESQLVWPSRHQPQLVFAYVSLRISCYHPYLEPTYSLSPFQAMFPFS